MFTLGTRGEFAGRAMSPGVREELRARAFAWHPIPEHLIWSGPPPQPVHEPEPEGSSTPRTQHTRRGRPSKSKQHRDEPSALDPSDTATSQRQRRPRKSHVSSKDLISNSGLTQHHYRPSRTPPKTNRIA